MFKTKRELETHKTKHSEERPFPCKKCIKRFKTKDVLRTHERTHTGDKRFKCTHCDKSFSQSVRDWPSSFI